MERQRVAPCLWAKHPTLMAATATGAEIKARTGYPIEGSVESISLSGCAGVARPVQPAARGQSCGLEPPPPPVLEYVRPYRVTSEARLKSYNWKEAVSSDQGLLKTMKAWL
jgi:hypothetical protein